MTSPWDIPFPLLPKQKIKEHDPTRPKPVLIAQQKADGHRTEIIKVDRHHVYAFNKKRSENIAPQLMAIPHLRAAIAHTPPSSYIIGELHCPGRPATDVVTMRKASDPDLCFMPFMVPRWHHRDLTNASWCEVVAILTRGGWHRAKARPGYYMYFCDHPGHSRLRLIEHEETEHLKAAARKRGWEGWVVKEEHCGTAYKIKPTRTLDAFVTKVNLSDCDSWAGHLQSLTVSVYHGTEVVEIANVGSGLEKEFRLTITEANAASLLGRVCEVRYDCLAGQGRLRFPRFLRWRDDEKTAKECTLSLQLPNHPLLRQNP